MTRYTITHINKDGMRVLTFANQAHKHYDTMTEAILAMETYHQSLEDKILGKAAATLEVRPVDCYDNGDAKGIYFD